MGFAILRTQKLKSPVAVHRSMKHAFRAQDTPNADIQRTPDNTHMGASSVAEGMDAFNARLPAKHRKDAVLAIEYLVAGSPDAMAAKDRAGQDRYFSDALKWLQDKHGAENVIYAGIHRDESTPHMYAYVVPRVGDTLNCKAFLGGAKALSAMQTDFAEKVGRQHGLERGIEGSRARHQTIREFYGRLTQPAPAITIRPDDVQPKVLAKSLLSKTVETPDMVADRLTAAVRSANASTAAAAATAASERRRAEEMARTAQSKTENLKAAQTAVQALSAAFVDGLTPEQTRALAQQAAKVREGNQIDAEKQRRVDAIPALLKRAAGAALTFAQHATEALRKALGQWRTVEWGKVEAAAIREAVTEHRQSRTDAVKAVLDHSPGMVPVARSPESRERVLAQAAELDRQHGLQPEPARRDRDRGGPGMGR
ncbi:MobV family relaxase [Dokdonella soli]|uniref:MobV family relaxase n=1 Tax=Dokdonella soli TaxID=529810 RepID=UPI00360E6C53